MLPWLSAGLCAGATASQLVGFAGPFSGGWCHPSVRRSALEWSTYAGKNEVELSRGNPQKIPDAASCAQACLAAYGSKLYCAQFNAGGLLDQWCWCQLKSSGKPQDFCWDEDDPDAVSYVFQNGDESVTTPIQCDHNLECSPEIYAAILDETCTDTNCTMFKDEICGTECRNELHGDDDQWDTWCDGYESPSCFGRDASTACRVSHVRASASAAFAQCFNGELGESGERVLMAQLRAGDLVVSATEQGFAFVDRVVVTQHSRAAHARASLLTLHHEAGELTITPDHVVLLDDVYAAARNARPGSTLVSADGAAVQVTRVSRGSGDVVNPLTTSGTILASSAHGAPVLASTHPEWVAAALLRGNQLPLPLPLCRLLSRLFPETAQAYYDDVLEPLFPPSRHPLLPLFRGFQLQQPEAKCDALRSTKRGASASVSLRRLLPLVSVSADVAFAAGFATYSACSALWRRCAQLGMALTTAAVANALRRAKRAR